MLKIKSRAPSTFGRLNVKTPPVWPDAKIGVMGGSFNPPHDGHVVVARTALRRLGLDRVWWLTTPGNPLKSHDELAPLDERMAAVRNLTTDPRMIVTSFEDQLATPFTAATLSFLISRYRAAHFVWLMGADNLATFHRWQRWRGIALQMPIAVIDRPNWTQKALASPAAQILKPWRLPEEKASTLVGGDPPRWVFLTTRLSPLSSTALRANSDPDLVLK